MFIPFSIAYPLRMVNCCYSQPWKHQKVTIQYLLCTHRLLKREGNIFFYFFKSGDPNGLSVSCT